MEILRALRRHDSESMNNNQRFYYAASAPKPNGLCCLNEGDSVHPDFKSVYHGSKYDCFLSIKVKYDPNHGFYATVIVKSDCCVRGHIGRLCKQRMIFNQTEIQHHTRAVLVRVSPLQFCRLIELATRNRYEDMNETLIPSEAYGMLEKETPCCF